MSFSRNCDLRFASTALSYETIIVLKLAQYRLILATLAYGFVG